MMILYALVGIVIGVIVTLLAVEILSVGRYEKGYIARGLEIGEEERKWSEYWKKKYLELVFKYPEFAEEKGGWVHGQNNKNTSRSI